MLEEIARSFASHRHERALSHALRNWVRDFVQVPTAGLTLLFQSFAYKHGIPLDTDMVFDVRCLPNPHYDPRLRPFTGRDQPVIDFCEADPDVQKMLGDIRRFIDEWLPCFDHDSRSYLTVAYRLHRRTASLGLSRRDAGALISASGTAAFSSDIASSAS